VHGRFQILVKSASTTQELFDLLLGALEGSHRERGAIIFGSNVVSVGENPLFGELSSPSDVVGWGDFEHEISSFSLQEGSEPSTEATVDIIVSKLRENGFKYELLVPEN